MNNVLQTALAEAVNSLANFFGTTTEAIMAHMPEFLAKYGWYSTLNELPIIMFISIFVAVLICWVYWCISEFKNPIRITVGVFIFSVVIGVGTKIITCAVAPEIVGIHAIIEFLSNMNYT